MKKITLSITVIMLFLVLKSAASVKDEVLENHAWVKTNNKVFQTDSTFTISKGNLAVFFKKYTQYQNYQKATENLYKSRKYKTIWYDDRSISELGHFLYNKANSITEEQGLKSKIPYIEDIDSIFTETTIEKPSRIESEILLTCMFVYYADKVYNGLDEKKVKELGWYLPKKEISYQKILDSLLKTPELINKNNTVFFSQYYKLQNALKKYQAIEKDYVWKKIDTTAVYKEFKPDDTSSTIAQIRNRLFIYGDLKEDSKKPVYDYELMAGVLNYKKRNGLLLNYTLDPEDIRILNFPIRKQIETILVNMERCRWISPALEEDKKYVMINIPSYRMVYVKDGKYALESKVFVGSRMNETVIFSGEIDRIVFSPYWNIPSSIVNNVLKFKVSQDPNYLTEQNIEVINGRYRQKPGANNSLGLVKFLFPNPNDIYMHDTPEKSLFNFETRTFSHGCINLQKAKELAILLLEDDPNWSADKVNEAMSGKEEIPYMLKNKIPIYIGYYTAWVQEDGQISFYKDIYNRDDRLLQALHLDQK